MLHLEPLHTPSQEPAPKVKPKDSDRRHQHHRKRAAPAAAPAPTAIHHLGRAQPGLETTPAARHQHPPLFFLPTFLSLFFLLSFSLSWLSSPAPGLRVPPNP